MERNGKTLILTTALYRFYQINLSDPITLYNKYAFHYVVHGRCFPW